VSIVDVTDRLDEVEQRIVDWDFTGAREAVQALLDEPDLSDDDRLTARRLLAEVLREQGDLDAAYDLADAVVTQAERRHGPSHPVTVHAVAVLAAIRHDYDEWDEAERLYHRVLDSGIDENGDDPVCRALRLARANLALLQRDRGNRPLALAMLNAAYVVHRREYGADDLDTIRIAAELAALQFADGNVAAARRLFTLAHASARARLGNRHPFTRAVEWELAAVEPPMPSAPVSAVPAPGEPPAPRKARRSSLAPSPVLKSTAAPSVTDPAEPPAPASPAPAPAPVVPRPRPRPRPAPRPVPPPAGPVSPPAPAVSPPDGPVSQPSHPVSPPDLDDDFWPPDDDPGPVSPGPAVHVPMYVTVPAREQPGEASEAFEDDAPRGLRIIFTVRAVVVVVVLALVLAGLAVWRTRGADRPTPGAAGPAATGTASAAVVPGASGAPGGTGVHDLQLRDERTVLTVTWKGVPATVVVAMSRAGAPAVLLAEVPPGTSEYVVRGVEPGVAYCIIVGPVDAAAALSLATSVCTGIR